MTTTPIAGFAPVFAGWNVWSVYQATSPDEGILGTIWHAGIEPAQLLKLWVENQVEDNAPGANVSDPLNPDATHFRGDSVQIIPSAGTLRVAIGRESLPELAGAVHLGKAGAEGTLAPQFVRFYNRGAQTTMPWPHDQNFLVDAVYLPDAKNPITNAPAPSTFSGAAKDAATAIEHGLETLAWVVGGAAAIFLLVKLGSNKS